MKPLANPIDFKNWLKNSTWWTVMCLCAMLCLIFTANSFWQSLLKKEQMLQDLFKENTIIVSVESDQRKKNVFYSTVDYFKSMRTKDPGISGFIFTDSKISAEDLISKQMIERSVSVLLSSDNFLDQLNGKFNWGSGFSYNDFMADMPYAIVTPRALDMIAQKGQTPSVIEIEGRKFKIIGEFRFENESYKENSMVILPMGALNLFGSTKKTYINKFVLKNDDGRALERLKSKVDEIQLSTGFIPVRPEYEVQGVTTTSQATSIYQKFLTPLFYALYSLFFVISIISFSQIKRNLSSYNTMVIDRIVAGWKPKDLALFIWKGLLIRYSLLTALSFSIAAFSILIFSHHFQLNLILNVSIPLAAALLVYPAVSWIAVSSAIKTQKRLVFSDSLFPLPSKWDYENVG